MRKILIFGATSAIAMETAKLLAAQGAMFFLVGRDAKKLGAVKADLITRGAKQADILASDMVDVRHHEDILAKAELALSGYTTVLIAYGSFSDQKGCEADYDLAEKEFRINFLSVVSILTRVSNYFEALKTGEIVVISSVAGERGRQSGYIYQAAKGGLSIFLQGLRNRLFKSGVHVLTVKPGFVDTPMTAGLKKGPLFATPQAVGRGIVRAMDRKADVVYLPWFWVIIMTIIKLIPEPIFKRMKL